MLVSDPALKTAAFDLCPRRGVLYLKAMIKTSQTGHFANSSTQAARACVDVNMG